MNQFQKSWRWMIGGAATLLLVATLAGIGNHHAFAQENQGERTPLSQSVNAPQGEKGAQGDQTEGNEEQNRQFGNTEAQDNSAQDNENGRFQNEGFRGGERRGDEEGLLFLLPLAVAGLLGVWVVRNWSNTNNRLISFLHRTSSKAQSSATPVNRTPSVLEIVKMRYAKGEINQAEFETLMHDLSGDVQSTVASA